MNEVYLPPHSKEYRILERYWKQELQGCGVYRSYALNLVKVILTLPPEDDNPVSKVEWTVKRY